MSPPTAVVFVVVFNSGGLLLHLILRWIEDPADTNECWSEGAIVEGISLSGGRILQLGPVVEDGGGIGDDPRYVDNACGFDGGPGG